MTIEQSMKIAQEKIETLVNETCDECMNIAKRNNLQVFWVKEEFQKTFSEKIKKEG